MRRRTKTIVIWVAAMGLGVLFMTYVAGCVREQQSDGTTVTHIDPNAVAPIEVAAEIGISIAAALGIVWPLSIPIGGILAALLAAWRKNRHKFVKSQSEAELYHNTTEAIVEAVEGWKNANETTWAKLKARLEKAIGPKAENVIRALRDLPPIE